MTHEEALALVARLGNVPETLKYPEKFARTYQLYRLIGYKPPKEFGLNVSSFWTRVTPHLDELDTFYVPKFFNNHTDDGRWYAFKLTPELEDLFPVTGEEDKWDL